MSGIVARLSALALVGLLGLALATLVLTSRGTVGGTELRAEFDDASPLVEGMSVRVSGAVAGSVRRIELDDRGVVQVTMRLHDGLPAARADATAAIRQQDLLGDSYLNLSLGHAREPLRGAIPRSRTVASPRFDEFFDIFEKPARDGARVLLTELGLALERRGVDLNAAILQLRPGLRAADELLTELRGQNSVLTGVLENSRAITRQIAGRTEDVDRAIVALRTTFEGLAAHKGALDRTLSTLPRALRAARDTTRRLRTATDAAVPLFGVLRDGAPGFGRAADLLEPFSGHLAATSRTLAHSLRTTTRALTTSAPALRQTRRNGPHLIAPIGLLLRPLESLFVDLAPALFGVNGKGGLAAMGLAGNNGLDPYTDPARAYLKAFLVPSCELFGRHIEPGCLARFLAEDVVPGAAAPRKRERAPRPAAAAPPAAVESPKPAERLPKIKVPKLPVPLPRAAEPVQQQVDRLLDFLLRP